MYIIAFLSFFYLTVVNVIAQEKNFTENDSVITVKENDEFTITLDANHSTGYRWFLEVEPISGLITVEEDRYVINEEEKGIDGAGGKEIWRFKAKTVGVVMLKFTYKRSREDDHVSLREFQINIE
jgi:predicted secreted protein